MYDKSTMDLSKHYLCTRKPNPGPGDADYQRLGGIQADISL